MKIPIEKQKAFIAAYENIRPDYIRFAGFLSEVLGRAVRAMSIMAIVQARPKDIASFANKIITKAKYQNPLTEMTDLCGGRVIVHFQSQVDKICDFIKASFIIDEANSLDLKSRLKVNEFGYRSVHYIITPSGDHILDVPVDPVFKTMKAEIQVRTLAEHIWADISHDRIYKTNLAIPDEWRRQAARLAAILEDADIDFGNMSKEIDALNRVYELETDREKAETEIQKLNTLMTVRAGIPNEAGLHALRLAAACRATGQCAEAAEYLLPWLDKPSEPLLNTGLWFEYGMNLCLAGCGPENKEKLYEGLQAIGHSFTITGNLSPEILTENADILSFYHYRYGKLLQRTGLTSGDPSESFETAYNLMPGNPLYVAAMLESLVSGNNIPETRLMGLFQPGTNQAIAHLKHLLQIGIKKVPAWFAIGHLHFFARHDAKCIEAYANAINIILDSRYYTDLSDIKAEAGLIGQMKHYHPFLEAQIQMYLRLALRLMPGCSGKAPETGTAPYRKTFKKPVVIVAGGASQMDEPKAALYTAHVRELMTGFGGTIISGGTTSGIPGLVGKVKKELQGTGNIEFEIIAYLPKKLPQDAILSDAYDEVVQTDAGQFSALDILTYWNDLICSGIPPADVVLIGIEGGKIATLEYMIALSLGARVGLIEHSGRAVSAFLGNRTWNSHPQLLRLPDDPCTLWALVNQSCTSLLSDEEIEFLAPRVHEHYRIRKMDSLNPESNDINHFKAVMPWEKLDASFQNANRRQIRFYGLMLQRVGLGIRRSAKPVHFDLRANLCAADYDLLARLEHARWNAERLLDGWKYGKEKDLVKKTSPYILAWDKLDEETRVYDYDPIDNMSLLLENIGYEIYKTHVKNI